MSHQSAYPSGSPSSGVKPHVKWTVIAVVALMLLAMLIYVLTDDESLQPGEAPQQPVPATAP